MVTANLWQQHNVPDLPWPLKVRKMLNNENPPLQLQRKQNPVGNLTNVTWDKEVLKEEVDNYPDGTRVNWSDLARRHNIQNTKGETAKNGGQIAQDWLTSAGANVKRFKRSNTTTEERIRRKNLRGRRRNHCRNSTNH